MSRLPALEYPVQVGDWVTPNGRPVRFAYREGTNDWNTISSCLTHDEYGYFGRKIGPVFVDVGGYVGSVGVAVAVDNPDCRVVIVEPVPDNADLIELNAATNGVGDRVHVFRGAAGPAGESETEVRYRYVGESSLEHHAFVGNSSLSYDTGGPVQHEVLTVPTLGLAALFDTFDIDEAYLKIDCEGGEWSFLDAPIEDLSRIIEAVGEVHAVRGHRGKDILGYLGQTHDVTLSGDPEATCEFRAVRREMV